MPRRLALLARWRCYGAVDIAWSSPSRRSLAPPPLVITRTRLRGMNYRSRALIGRVRGRGRCVTPEGAPGIARCMLSRRPHAHLSARAEHARSTAAPSRSGAGSLVTAELTGFIAHSPARDAEGSRVPPDVDARRPRNSEGRAPSASDKDRAADLRGNRRPRPLRGATGWLTARCPPRSMPISTQDPSTPARRPPSRTPTREPDVTPWRGKSQHAPAPEPTARRGGSLPSLRP